MKLAFQQKLLIFDKVFQKVELGVSKCYIIPNLLPIQFKSFTCLSKQNKDQRSINLRNGPSFQKSCSSSKNGFPFSIFDILCASLFLGGRNHYFLVGLLKSYCKVLDSRLAMGKKECYKNRQIKSNLHNACWMDWISITCFTSRLALENTSIVNLTCRNAQKSQCPQ